MVNKVNKPKTLKELDESVRRLVMNKLKGEEKKEKGSKKSWIGVIGAKRVLEVFDKGPNSIRLEQGLFLVKRKPKRDAVFLIPPTSLLPCGWFSREQLEKIVIEEEAGV